MAKIKKAPKGSLRRVISGITKNWLKEHGKEVEVRAKRHYNKGKKHHRTQDPKIRATVSGHRLKLSGISTFWKPAFDQKFKVPPGGLAREDGKQWRMVKPEGIVYRSRIYTKRAGEIIKFKGYFSQAMREVFYGKPGRDNRADLAHSYAIAIVDNIVKQLVMGARGDAVRIETGRRFI